ncbi:MAG: RsmB/NOP family class I SAM-dependent RNA methyltransferase [Acidimicrobiia bacterium]|nr:RsmB/NOP family class I SAM-dependent RNA methyltransferase [Acidimicrobiia bacterium]
MKASARVQATISVDRILNRGAYSNVLTAATVVQPPSDHPFYQRLVYTTIRHLPFIDAAIEASSSRPIADMDTTVSSVLRIAGAELVYLGTKPHAAVHEAVETTRTLGRSRASGFVNAVLRSLVELDPRPAGTVDESYPEAVVDAVNRAMGPIDGAAFLDASNSPAPTGVRVRSERPAHARYLDHDERLESLLATGTVDVIDPASAAVVAALDPQPGELILDMAAAPGGKTRAIADTAPGAMVIAVDRHRRRLVDAARRSSDIRAISWVVADGRTMPFRSHSFDRVLIDAPCTGLGVMRRRPEIRHRFTAQAARDASGLQSLLVERALEMVRPGGTVVYSACTVTPDETSEVVRGCGFHAPGGIDGRPWGDGVLLAPHITGTDGMFIAVHGT